MTNHLQESSNHLRIGDRVSVIFREDFRIRVVDNTSDVEREGCLLISQPCGDMGIAFDHRINFAPSAKEVEMNKRFKVPGDGLNFLLLRASEIGTVVTITKIQISIMSCNKSCMLLCNLKGCSKVKRRGSMLMTCHREHHICAWHVAPWQEDRQRVNEDTIAPLVQLIKSDIMYSHLPLKAIETKAALSYNTWSSSRDPAVRVAMISTIVRLEHRPCECCYDGAKKSPLPLSFWTDQLFGLGLGLGHGGSPMMSQLTPSSSSSSSVMRRTPSHKSAHHPHRQSSRHHNNHTDSDQSRHRNTVVPADTMKELRRRGFLNHEIETVVAQLSLAELCGADADLLHGLIESSRSQLHEQERRHSETTVMGTMVMGTAGTTVAVGGDDRHNHHENSRIIGNDGMALSASSVSLSFSKKSRSVSFSEDQLANRVTRLVMPALPSGLLVLAQSVARRKQVAVKLQIGIMHRDLLTLLCDMLDLSVDRDDSIFRVDEEGWSEEVVPLLPDPVSVPVPFHTDHTDPNPNPSPSSSSTPSLSPSPSPPLSSVCSLLNLRAGDLLSVRGARDSVGPRMRLNVLAGQYRGNVGLVHKVEEMGSEYIGWRAIIFGLLEQLVLAKDREGLRRLSVTLHTAITAACLSSSEDILVMTTMIDTLQSAADGKIWFAGDASEVETAFLAPESEGRFDLALVLACRLTVSLCISSDPNRDLNGLPIIDAILPSYPDVKSLSEYCQVYVETMGVDAEGPLVSCGLLFEALHCSGCTVILDRRTEVDLSLIETSCVQKSQSQVSSSSSPSSSSTPPLSPVRDIHLLLRPGHYDLLYPRPRPPRPVSDTCGPPKQTFIRRISETKHTIETEMETETTRTGDVDLQYSTTTTHSSTAELLERTMSNPRGVGKEAGGGVAVAGVVHRLWWPLPMLCCGGTSVE
eukprot:gene5581-11240_t